MGAGLDARIFAIVTAAALAQLADPACQPRWRVVVIYKGLADALDQHEMADTRGKCAGVKERNSAAHGMTDEMNAFDTEGLNDAVKIKNVIRKMVIAASPNPAAITVAAAIRCNNPQRLPRFFFELRHEELPTMRLIEKAVHQNERLARRFPPFEIVNCQAEGVDEFMARLGHEIKFFGSAAR